MGWVVSVTRAGILMVTSDWVAATTSALSPQTLISLLLGWAVMKPVPEIVIYLPPAKDASTWEALGATEKSIVNV